MAQANKLTALKVERMAKPGKYADGLGLYLFVTPSKTKSWVYRYQLNGKSHEMGLGPTHAVSLVDARTAAKECRNLLVAGRDPLAAKTSAFAAACTQAIAEAAAADVKTFKWCAEEFIKAKEGGWVTPKTAEQIRTRFETYVYPVIGDLPVNGITTDHVKEIITPIWATKNETASKVRERIEHVLSWAKAHGYRVGENPAIWRDNLTYILPSRNKIAPVTNMPALHYDDVPDFMAKLIALPGDGPRALEFAILTAMRTAAIRGAKLDQFNFSKKIWTVPGNNMKAVRNELGKPFDVALSDRAIALVKAQPNNASYVFTGYRDRCISENTMLEVQYRMGMKGISTTHGFRSTFKDWSAEKTSHDHLVSETALGHSVGDAYLRGIFLEKRFALMNDWAGYCYSAC